MPGARLPDCDRRAHRDERPQRESVIAAAAPIVGEWIPRVRLALVVLEICLGILVGPQVLEWADVRPMVQVRANFGLVALFFLAGFELDFPAVSGRPIAIATLG